MSTFTTPGGGALVLLEEQPQAPALGLKKVRPLAVGVSEKSMVTPSSISRDSAGRKSLRSPTASTSSPARGAPSTVNSEL